MEEEAIAPELPARSESGNQKEFWCKGTTSDYLALLHEVARSFLVEVIVKRVCKETPYNTTITHTHVHKHKGTQALASNICGFKS